MLPHNDVLPDAFSGGSYLQTLSRGARVLEMLGNAEDPPTAGEIAEACGLAMPVAYRVLTTLKAHNLVRCDSGGRYSLGYALISLARKVDVDFRNGARDICAQVATRLNATAFVWVQDGDELVCIVSIEPARPGTHVRWREGMRHSVKSSASTIAIQAGRPPRANESREISLARERGYATSTGAVETGVRATAAPILERNGCRMSIAVLTPENAPKLTSGEIVLLQDAANRLSKLAAIASPQEWTWAAETKF